MILEIFPTGPYLTNAILLACEITLKAVVIDPGVGCEKEILNFAKEKNLQIEKILITHSHWDHTADVYELKKKTNAKVYIHKEDAPNLEKPGSDKLPLFAKIKGVKPDHFVKDKEIIKVGKLNLEVIYTPGHSPGGVCYYLKKEKVLISGDTLFQGSIGNISFPFSDPEKMWESLKKLSKLPPDTKVIPGHGDSTTIGKEKWLDEAEEYFS